MEWASRRTFWVVLLVLACAVYAPALTYGFISYDDEIYVYDTHHERFTAAPTMGQLWGPFAILGIISLVALRSGRVHPYLLTGWLFYLISFLPVIGLLQYAGYFIDDLYAYVPSTGAFIVAAWGIHAWLRCLSNGHFFLRGVTSAVALVFALLSLLQVGYWRSGEELFQHALDLAPDNARIHNLLGIEARRGAVNVAQQHFVHAVELSPSHTRAMNNLGVLLYRAGRASKATSIYQRILRITPHEPSAHTNLAHTFASEGHFAEAEKHYRIAIRHDPAFAGARVGLARLLVSTGRPQDTRREIETAIKLYPNRSELRDALAGIAGQPENGIQELGDTK